VSRHLYRLRLCSLYPFISDYIPTAAETETPYSTVLVCLAVSLSTGTVCPLILQCSFRVTSHITQFLNAFCVLCLYVTLNISTPKISSRVFKFFHLWVIQDDLLYRYEMRSCDETLSTIQPDSDMKEPDRYGSTSALPPSRRTCCDLHMSTS
jgi:hypothetical protein